MDEQRVTEATARLRALAAAMIEARHAATRLQRACTELASAAEAVRVAFEALDIPLSTCDSKEV